MIKSKSPYFPISILLVFVFILSRSPYCPLLPISPASFIHENWRLLVVGLISIPIYPITLLGSCMTQKKIAGWNSRLKNINPSTIYFSPRYLLVLFSIFRYVNHDGTQPNVRVDVSSSSPLSPPSSPPLSPSSSPPYRGGKKGGIPSRQDYISSKKGESFQIRMTALTPISEGDELCFDYGPLYTPAEGWT